MLHLRSCSSQSASSDVPSLSRHLSRLWLKIHPDLFSQHPEEQAVNEQSFKALQEALAIAESNGDDSKGMGRPPGRPIFSKGTKVSFYYRDDNRKTKLDKTSVTLRDGQIGNALLQLFTSLSLEPPPQNVLPQSSVDSGEFPNRTAKRRRSRDVAVSLRSIVREARMAGMAAMQAKQDGSAAEARAAEWAQSDSDMLRLVLQRTRGVSIDLGSGLPRRGGRAVGIDRLAAALKRCPDADIAGLRVIVDGGLETKLHSPRAELVLGIYTTDARWDGALSSEATYAAAAERRALAATERAAAKCLGLSHILFCHNADGGDNVTAQGDYTAYKEFLAFLVGRTGKTSRGGKPMIEAIEIISLVLEGSPKTGPRAPSDFSKGIIAADAVEGVLTVDVRAPADIILSALTTVGVSVAAECESLRAQAEAEKQLVWRVARALRIDSLRRADDLSNDQWGQALSDLLADAGRIGGIMDRSNVVVGSNSCLTEDGDVQIAWNFRDTLPL